MQSFSRHFRASAKRVETMPDETLDKIRFPKDLSCNLSLSQLSLNDDTQP
jgi:hypothetical protein